MQVAYRAVSALKRGLCVAVARARHYLSHSAAASRGIQRLSLELVVGMCVALYPTMLREMSEVIALGACAASLAVLTVPACTHPATDRVIEPAGASDASSPSPASPLSDAGTAPIGPVADPLEPASDYHALRAPELGLASEIRYEPWQVGPPAPGGGGGAGGAEDGGIGPHAGVPSTGGGIFR